VIEDELEKLKETLNMIREQEMMLMQRIHVDTTRENTFSISEVQDSDPNTKVILDDESSMMIID
jgi:hypothetical protein